MIGIIKNNHMPTKFLPTKDQRTRLCNQLDFFIANGYSSMYATYHLAILCQGLNIEVECDKLPEGEEELIAHMDILLQTLGYQRVGDWKDGTIRKIDAATEGK
jgi:hypothetical protein